MQYMLVTHEEGNGQGIENDRESVAGCGGQESPLRYGDILIGI